METASTVASAVELASRWGFSSASSGPSCAPCVSGTGAVPIHDQGHLPTPPPPINLEPFPSPSHYFATLAFPWNGRGATWWDGDGDGALSLCRTPTAPFPPPSHNSAALRTPPHPIPITAQPFRPLPSRPLSQHFVALSTPSRPLPISLHSSPPLPFPPPPFPPLSTPPASPPPPPLCSPSHPFPALLITARPFRSLPACFPSHVSHAYPFSHPSHHFASLPTPSTPPPPPPPHTHTHHHHHHHHHSAALPYSLPGPLAITLQSFPPCPAWEEGGGGQGTEGLRSGGRGREGSGRFAIKCYEVMGMGAGRAREGCKVVGGAGVETASK